MASYVELPPNKKGEPGIKITVEHGYDEVTGERIRHFKTVRMKKLTDRAIKKAITDFEIEVANKENANKLENLTFAQFVERWLDMYVRVKLSIGTRDAYIHRLNDGPIDELGDIKISKIKPYDIVLFFKEQQEKKATNLEGKYNALSSVFKKAVQWKVIKDNPMDGVDRPNVEKKKREIEFYDDEQLKYLLSVLDNEPSVVRIQIKLAALVGLRMSEIAGIRTECVNYNDCTILIDKTLKYDKEKKRLFLGPTKSKEERVVYVPKKLMEEIKEYEKQQKKIKMASENTWEPLLDENENPINLLFTKSNGFPRHPDWLSGRWQKIVDKYNLPKINLHGLRHTYATYMLRKDVNIKIIQTQLGHKDGKLTINTYSHSTDKDKSNASDLFNEIL